MFSTRAVGWVPSYMQCRSIIHVERRALEVLLNLNSVIMLWRNTASLTADFPAASSASVVDWAVNPFVPTLKLTRPMHIITLYDELNFSLSRLLPQLVSELLGLNPLGCVYRRR